MNHYKHGLTIMRAQPFHIGHERIIKQMLTQCDKVTVLLGSLQEQGTFRNPFSYTQRKKMILNVFEHETPRLKVLGIFDIHNLQEWMVFVLDFLNEAAPDRDAPDVYFSGSSKDAPWVYDYFEHIECIDRTDISFPYVSGSMVRDMISIGDIRWKNFVNEKNHHFIEDFIISGKGEF